MKSSSIVISALLLALGCVLSSYLIASEFRRAKEANQVIKVVGSAKKPLTSDHGMLQATISGSGVSQKDALGSLKQQKAPLLEFLSERGFPQSEVTFKPVFDNHLFEYDKNGRYTGKVIRYHFKQGFSVSSSDVQKIRALSLALVELINNGVSVKVNQPQYHYTKLAEVKVEVQSLAAADAKARAIKIAKATGTELGPIRGARMGVLQITPRNSTVVSDYGVNDTTSIEKEITAVVSAEFQVR